MKTYRRTESDFVVNLTTEEVDADHVSVIARTIYKTGEVSIVTNDYADKEEIRNYIEAFYYKEVTE